MADEDKLVKAGVEAALKPFADLLEKLAGPAAAEIGFTLKDHVRVFRFKRQLRLFERVKEMLAKSKMEPGRVPLKLLLPVVENASVEENNDLQDRWAAMLANAAIKRDVHPSFPEVLKQLNERDALYLDLTYEYEEGKKVLDGQRRIVAIKRKEGYRELENIFMLKLARGIGIQSVEHQYAREKLNALLVYSGFQENVIRLGLMSSVKDVGDRLTGFGAAFVKACRPPVAADKSDRS
jgi:hypothetical protein